MTVAPGGPSAGLSNLPVVSFDCEQSRRRLMITLAQHRRTEAALASLVPIGGRLKVLPPGSTQAQNRRESVLVRCVSIVESFVADQLVMRIASQVPMPRAALVEDLYGQFEDKGTASWRSMDEYYKTHVSKDVKIRHGQSPFIKVDPIIEARNAVIHGLGRFTATQQRKNVPNRVKHGLTTLKFDLSADGLTVVVTPAAVEEAVAALRTYLEWVDAQLTQHAPL